MALIWAKKSTGLPIDVISAHAGSGGTRPAGGGAGGSGASSAAAADVDSAAAVLGVAAAGAARVPSKLTVLKLDIDIHKNCPNVLEHALVDNADGRLGTELSVCIAGAWGAYRARVMHYFQQVRTDGAGDVV